MNNKRFFSLLLLASGGFIPSYMVCAASKVESGQADSGENRSFEQEIEELGRIYFDSLGKKLELTKEEFEKYKERVAQGLSKFAYDNYRGRFIAGPARLIGEDLKDLQILNYLGLTDARKLLQMYNKQYPATSFMITKILPIKRGVEIKPAQHSINEVVDYLRPEKEFNDYWYETAQKGISKSAYDQYRKEISSVSFKDHLRKELQTLAKYGNTDARNLLTIYNNGQKDEKKIQILPVLPGIKVRPADFK